MIQSNESRLSNKKPYSSISFGFFFHRNSHNQIANTSNTIAQLKALIGLSLHNIFHVTFYYIISFT